MKSVFSSRHGRLIYSDFFTDRIDSVTQNVIHRNAADQKQNGAKCMVRDICRASVHGRVTLTYHRNLPDTVQTARGYVLNCNNYLTHSLLFS